MDAPVPVPFGRSIRYGANVDMISPQDSKLTDRQRECLVLVAQGYETKEIARQIGLSPDTVDMHVKNALKRLGVSSRREAARLVAGVPQPLVHPSAVISDPPGSEETAAPPTERAEAASPAGIGTPWPVTRGQLNRLSVAQRMIWIVLIALGLTMTAGTMVSALEGLSRMF